MSDLAPGVRETLADDIGRWRDDGLIDPATFAVLAERYRARELGFDQVLRYLGIGGGICMALGLAGLVAAMAESAALAGVMTAVFSLFGFRAGLRMARDPGNRYPISSKAVLTAAAAAAGAAVALLALALDASEGQMLIALGVSWLPLLFWVAYRYQNGMVLIIAVGAVIHWIGTYNEMIGRSSYSIEIEAPRVMLGASALAVAIGVLHLRRSSAFSETAYRVYAALGLLYFNLSWLILSIVERDYRLLFVIGAFVLALAQVIAGARLRRSLLVGFGATFFLVHLFTRCFETLWDALSVGLFMAAAGSILLVAAALLERGLARLLAAGEGDGG